MSHASVSIYLDRHAAFELIELDRTPDIGPMRMIYAYDGLNGREIATLPIHPEAAVALRARLDRVIEEALKKAESPVVAVTR